MFVSLLFFLFFLTAWKLGTISWTLISGSFLFVINSAVLVVIFYAFHCGGFHRTANRNWDVAILASSRLLLIAWAVNATNIRRPFFLVYLVSELNRPTLRVFVVIVVIVETLGRVPG